MPRNEHSNNPVELTERQRELLGAARDLKEQARRLHALMRADGLRPDEKGYFVNLSRCFVENWCCDAHPALNGLIYIDRIHCFGCHQDRTAYSIEHRQKVEKMRALAKAFDVEDWEILQELRNEGSGDDT